MFKEKSNISLGIAVGGEVDNRGRERSPYVVQQVICQDGEIVEILEDIKTFKTKKGAFDYAQSIGMDYEGTFWKFCR